jgi:enoyl-CoA hydratase/carnithine racemase
MNSRPRSTTAKLQLAYEGSTALLTINNPPANTWDEESLTALPQLINSLNRDPQTTCLILTGSGSKFFSAGADLKLFADGDKARARKMARLFGEAFETLSTFQGLSIAAINGFAMGGGLECALACDLRVVSEQAVLALPEASVGLLPCAGGTQNLTLLVGEGWAKRMILLGEKITAGQAFDIGLVEACVAPDQVLPIARKWAKASQRQSPAAVRACKQLIQSGRHAPIAQALPVERELFVDLFDTLDQQEGVNAFLEKRQPKWKNA